MLDGSSSRTAHAAQNLALVLLSFLFIPLDFTILCLSYGARIVLWPHLRITGKNHAQASNRRTVLVTGVGMTKGLVLARLFNKAGHKVIGADFEPYASVPGRVSNSLAKFYRLEKPAPSAGSGNYIQGLLNVILKERVDLWVSCSGVASAVEDGEAKEVVENRTQCKAVQFDVATTQTLHEKHTFIQHTREIGLHVPETHHITNREDVDRALEEAPAGRKYIMKPIGMDDAARGDMTLLPKASLSETNSHLDRLRISTKSAWILQQFIHGEEYCTHALVVKGQVKAFVACPSAELLMHYEALPETSPLSKAMLAFTQQYAKIGGIGFTGHLSFDFLVEDSSPADSKEIVLYPIECNPRAHTAVALFNGTSAMVDGYLSLLELPTENHSAVITPSQHNSYYWIGHDIVTRLVLPLAQMLTLKIDLQQFLQGIVELLVHIAFWKDGTYDVIDPLPWFWLYHVYWPRIFLHCLVTGKKWSRVNVSTLKMFEC